ncbi:hypothetical protein [Nocardia asteroides]|uniref:hypothetical protein n=1 Tax=Nocardia asteroides TaxID=1824 RepID=UPI00364A96BB
MSGELTRLDEYDGGDQDRPAAWVQHDDGSLWVLDDYGVPWPVAAVTSLFQLDADVQAALGAIGDSVDVTALSVVDTEVDR